MERARGPVLLLDAGDSLTKEALQAPPPQVRASAQTVLEVMGRLRYDAMAVGERDLVIGVDELKRRAAEAHITLLAANLTKNGKPVFEERKLFTIGGQKVGVFAVVDGENYRRMFDLTVEAREARAQAQIDALRKAGAKLVVGLLHMEYDAALRLANNLKGADYFVESHTGREHGSQRLGGAVLVAGGFEGTALGRAEFDLSGGGPLFDRNEANDARDQLRQLEMDVEHLRGEIQRNPKARTMNEQLIKLKSNQRSSLVARADAKPPKNGRSVATEWAKLGPNIESDPEIVKLVGDAK